MSNFHYFSRLPPELRIQIWGLATEDRVLRVRKTRDGQDGFWSPTPIPAVTRASFESREHCSYRKAFIIDLSTRYIWVNYDHDIIQMRYRLLKNENDNPVWREDIRHLRIDLVDEQGFDETEMFYYHYAYVIYNIARLESFDILVGNGLAQWTDFIKESSWRAFFRKNVRIVDRKTGEWIDEGTSPVYQDYVDTNWGENDHFTRVVEEDYEGHPEEDDESRFQAIKRLQMPLPRINLYN
ncbi:hypothetical protein BCR34DRAFT_610876 [Clohesyomyces aquaticus]|uniref:2EXR domain-containing protein n=1 Tax=Clohesyomyces aquaticus TaxID=1231657 RepID=A0A1Y2A4G3_9PLEO|nr:hypothetical protein BCR34DRAFT_610876 [Clohesyomyces aquaticus]